MLRQVAQAGLEANAAMKSIVRRGTQESYTDYLKRLAEAEELEATDEAALRHMDRRRSKKGSNADWINLHDPEAQITRLKDGRTTEHALRPYPCVPDVQRARAGARQAAFQHWRGGAQSGVWGCCGT